jgi:hypothetical protein
LDDDFPGSDGEEVEDGQIVPPETNNDSDYDNDPDDPYAPPKTPHPPNPLESIVRQQWEVDE